MNKSQAVSKIAVNFSVNHWNLRHKDKGDHSCQCKDTFSCCAFVVSAGVSFSLLSTIANIYSFPFDIEKRDYITSAQLNVLNVISSDLILRQAHLFTDILIDAYNQNSTHELPDIQPSISGLLQCLKSGWRPQELSKVNL